MATLTLQDIIRTGTGLEPTYAACGAGGDEFVNEAGYFIHIKNGAGAPQTVTIATPVTTDGLAVADVAIAIPAGEERMIGPFATATFNDGDDKVQLTYSAVVTLTIAILNV